MVAMRALDMVVGLSWLGLLASVLVGQAVLAWWRYRWATGLARRAERLSRSIQHERSPEGTAALGRTPAARPGAAVSPR